MNDQTPASKQTRALLAQHFHAYPQLQAQDIFKFLFHSACGCEHLVKDAQAALRYIQDEYATLPPSAAAHTDKLDGAYSRVHLGILHGGLRPETLTRLFCLSAQGEPNGKAQLEQKLALATQMVKDGTLPLDAQEFYRALDAWRAAGFPAVHHSQAFRQAYSPAYRVIANRYAEFLPVFTAIDRQLQNGNCIVAIEGGSASGKTTLASLLEHVYGCCVFQTDDFFLRPEQRTAKRLTEIGGNLDRERFATEVLRPLCAGETVRYRRFDCTTQALDQPTEVRPGALTVIEGTYSLHPDFGKYYDLAVFLDVDPATQKQRITTRNAPGLAKRFFDEWIPLENAYFTKMDISTQADLHFSVFCIFISSIYSSISPKRTILYNRQTAPSIRLGCRFLSICILSICVISIYITLI